MPIMHLASRPIEDKDIPVICDFPQGEEELFFMFPKASYPLTPAQLRESVASRTDSTVVERGGEVVGYANLYQCTKGDACFIGNVIVAPNARGGGLGRYLLETMADIARARHQASEVRVSCFNGNAPALLLYARLGFQPFAMEDRKDWKGRRVALIHLRRKAARA